MKLRSGRCDENGFICGGCTTVNSRSDSFCKRSKSRGDSISVYDVITIGHAEETAAFIVSGQVSNPLKPVVR